MTGEVVDPAFKPVRVLADRWLEAAVDLREFAALENVARWPQLAGLLVALAGSFERAPVDARVRGHWDWRAGDVETLAAVEALVGTRWRGGKP